LYFHHDERQRVDTVGDGTERVWTYSYWDGLRPGGKLGDLQSALLPAVTWTADPHPPALFSYTYDSASPHKMRTVQDPLGNEKTLAALMSLDYYQSGQVKTQQYGDGTYTFTYSATRTDIEDRNGNKQSYDFKAGMTGELDTLPVIYPAIDPPATI